MKDAYTQNLYAYTAFKKGEITFSLYLQNHFVLSAKVCVNQGVRIDNVQGV